MRNFTAFEKIGPVSVSPPILPSEPPLPPSSWTPRTSWPFDEDLVNGRGLYGCFDFTRSRFLVLGFAHNEFNIAAGDFLAVSDDNAVTWDPRTLSWDPGYPGNLCIARSESLDRVLVGGRVNNTGTASYTGYSDDGGDTWTENMVVITGTFPTYYPYPTDIMSLLWIEEQSQYILGTANLATSPNGTSWTLRMKPSSGGLIYDIAYSPVDDRIVIVNGQNVFTSDDSGVTWTLRTTPFDGGQIVVVEWMPSISKFMAGCNNSGSTRSIMFSDDGITWVQPTLQINDAGYVNPYQYQTFGMLDIGPQILTSPFVPSSSGPINIRVSEDGGTNWVGSENSGGTILSFVLGDGVVLALGGYDGGYAIMSSPIPVLV